MSQNHSDTDYKNIVTELEKSDEQRETQVAQRMREQRKGVFE
jgi:transcriptional regulator